MMISEEAKLAAKIDFANRSFRDQADQNYIMARVAYRLKLPEQVLWNASQAIEKYLKAILLYNGKSAKGLGHDLGKALLRVEEIKDIPFKFSSVTLDFIKYIDDYGADRYLSKSFTLRLGVLLDLDATVWHLRRYCYFLRGEIKGDSALGLEMQLKFIHHELFDKESHKFRITGGFLEKVIEKNEPAAKDLKWKNFFYGKIKKNKVKNYRFYMEYKNPTHTLHPEVFVELSKVIDFPKGIKKAFESEE